MTTTVGVMLDARDGVATLQLNRPHCGNAIDLPTARALHAALRELAEWDVGAVVITGRGDTFCAGGDVRAMASTDNLAAFLAELAEVVHESLLLLRELAVPVVAAVNGPAAGAGLGLVLSADLVLASRAARFLCAYGSIGLSPDCGVSALLPAVVGARRAALLALTDLSLSADQALAWGIATDICEPAALAERATEIAYRLATRPRIATGETARLLRAASSRTYAQQLADEATTIARLGTTADAARLVNRFVE
ncbi:MAG TPA: enoyl-CoA hydratase/isomerase family protein [Jatrophihabitantaceae bacterium]|jgi:2-(1,2-epoxy-1,2-dihydrophenyl)acetyl-CoA isomerase